MNMNIADGELSQRNKKTKQNVPMILVFKMADDV